MKFIGFIGLHLTCIHFERLNLSAAHRTFQILGHEWPCGHALTVKSPPNANLICAKFQKEIDVVKLTFTMKVNMLSGILP